MRQSLSFLHGHHLKSDLSKYVGNFITFMQRFPAVTNPIVQNIPSAQLKYNEHICNIDLLDVLAECILVKQAIKDNTYTTYNAVCVRYVNGNPVEEKPVTIYILRLKDNDFVAEFYVNDSGHMHVPENITVIRIIQQDGEINAFITSSQIQYHFIYCSSIIITAADDGESSDNHVPISKRAIFHLNKTVVLQASRGYGARIVSDTSCFIALKYLLNFLETNSLSFKVIDDIALINSKQFILESFQMRNGRLSKMMVPDKLEKLLTKFYINYEQHSNELSEYHYSKSVSKLKPKNRNLPNILLSIASDALALVTGDRD
jgi:hypothetical protein